MKLKKIDRKIIVGMLFLLTIFGGAFLAKISPLKTDHFFFKQVDQSKEMESVELSTTQETTSSKEKILQYDEIVNKMLVDGQLSGHFNIPLQLQTDEEWKETSYGIGNPDGNTLGINGCAITSLAMITTFLDGKNTTPLDILNWAKNDYYLEGEGTTWAIFSEFSAIKGYQCEELGMDMSAVEEQLKKKRPVIISVKPGYFTETGHIMVITGMKDGKFWVNDPNDSEMKGHSKKLFTKEELEKEAINFWTIYK